MKKLFAALALISAGYAATTQASDVGVSISIGQPGFYGQLDIGSYGRPQVVYGQPVWVERRHWNPAPVYLRVPPRHANNWRQYCGRYNACARPVYFVRDDWYRNVYAPRYRQLHRNRDAYAYERQADRRDGRYNDRYNDRRDDRRDDRGYNPGYDRPDRDHDRDHH